MVKGTKKRGAGFFDDITNTVTGAYQKAKAAVVGPTQDVLDTSLPQEVTAPASQQVGTAPEQPGYTSAGGKRLGKKTRKSKKGMKKTMRRKH